MRRAKSLDADRFIFSFRIDYILNSKLEKSLNQSTMSLTSSSRFLNSWLPKGTFLLGIVVAAFVDPSLILLSGIVSALALRF